MGDIVEAVLPQNAGTGYVWQLEPLPADLTLVGDRTNRQPRWRPAPPASAGSPFGRADRAC